MYLPYSMLLGIVSSPRKVSETVLNFSFEISIPTVQTYDKVVDQLKKYIYSLPWTVLKNEPYFQLMRKRVEIFISQNLKEQKNTQ